MKHSQIGISLIEATIGVALLGTFILFGSRAFHVLSHKRAEANRQLQLDEKNLELDWFLKAYVGGLKSFQSLSFRIPSSLGSIQAFSSGLHVAQDTDLHGVPLSLSYSPKSDLISFFVKVPLPIELRLQEVADEGALSLLLNGSNVSSLLTDGDFLVVTDTRVSEMLRVADLLGNLSLEGPNSRIALTPDWFDFTYKGQGPIGLRNGYSKGDIVFKAKLVQVGFDVGNNCIGLKEGGEIKRQWCGYQSFQMYYRWNPSPSCKIYTIGTVSNEFERAEWSRINSGYQTAYRCISDIRMEFRPLDPKLKNTFVEFRTNQ